MKTTVCVFCLVFLTLLAGCAIQPQPAPSASYLMLTINADEAPPVLAAEDSCLRVRPVAVQPAFAGAALIYRTGEAVWQKDYYNTFLTPPDRQIGDALIGWLRAAGMRVCIDGLTAGDRRLTLEPHLEALYADFRNPDAPEAIARLRLVLTRYDRSCRCSSIMLDKTFDAAVPLLSKPPAEDIVQAMSGAVQNVLEQFHPVLQKTFFDLDNPPQQ